MARIVLRPMPQPDDGVCIGTYDDVPLVMTGRAYRAGDVAISQEALGEDLVEAVDDAATQVLGHEWVTSLARLMQINRRSTSRDRIAKFGLPEYVLRFLADAAAHVHPRALGHALLCVEAIQEANTRSQYTTGRPANIDLINRDLEIRETMRSAMSVVDEVLAEREAFRKRKGDGLTGE